MKDIIIKIFGVHGFFGVYSMELIYIYIYVLELIGVANCVAEFFCAFLHAFLQAMGIICDMSRFWARMRAGKFSRIKIKKDTIVDTLAKNYTHETKMLIITLK